MIENIGKVFVPLSIIIGSTIIGGFYYYAQINKQDSIERQNQAELTSEKEKYAREFSASQKNSCLDIYKQESTKWNNTNGWRYDEDADDCYIQYKENPKKTEAQCDEAYKDEDGKVYTWAFNDWLLCQDGLFEKLF